MMTVIEAAFWGLVLFGAGAAGGAILCGKVSNAGKGRKRSQGIHQNLESALRSVAGD